MIQQNSCPVCKSSSLNQFLHRNNVPIHQNYLFDDQDSAIKITRGNLSLALCSDCDFIFNLDFDSSKMRYGEKYENTQDMSPFFDSYTKELVNDLVFQKKIRDCTIIELGCGKGSFLRKLVENKEWNNVGIGFDPSYVGPDSEFDGRLKFENRFFEYDCIDGFTTDAIVCRHVIEHIADPIKFLKTTRESLKSDESKTKIFFETPTVDWILLNQVFYDFFYEHCSYFTERSLVTAFQISGFDVKSVNIIFNGQYLLLEATPAPNNDNHIIKKPGVTADLTNKYTKAESKIGEDWNKKIAELTASGKIAIWGAGAKGVTFANFIDPAKQLIDCVIDLNPKKQGKYIPGTGHQIVAPKDIPSRNISSAILMNPNYHKEILELLEKSGIQINIVI